MTTCTFAQVVARLVRRVTLPIPIDQVEDVVRAPIPRRYALITHMAFCNELPETTPMFEMLRATWPSRSRRSTHPMTSSIFGQSTANAGGAKAGA